MVEVALFQLYIILLGQARDAYLHRLGCLFIQLSEVLRQRKPHAILCEDPLVLFQQGGLLKRDIARHRQQ